MSKTLALGVVLGATLSGTFSGVVGSAKNTLNSLGSTVKLLERDFKSLKKEQVAFDKGSFAGPVRQIANYKQLSVALLDAKKNSEALTKSLRAHQEAKVYRQSIVNDVRKTAMTGAAVAAPVIGSVKAFMDQEEASTNMKMAYMKAGGGVSEAFEGIRLKALELGNALPGTTTDFMNLGRVLKEQGLADDVIKNGALESAAKLNVLLGTSQEFGGEFIAKLMEARGINDKELGAAADLVQRARYAFGMKPQDMMDSMRYDAPIANVLNIAGLDKTKEMLALQGMGATKGLEGAQWGTNLRALMQRMGEGVDGVKTATKGNKAVARGQMEESGVDFQFYDKNGKYKGPEAMVAELEKLKIIKDKLGEKAAINVAGEVFGTEAAGAAMIIAEKGTKGLAENKQRMDEQASMQERMAEQSKSLKTIWESLTGTALNLAASLGSVFGDDLKEGFKSANDFVGNTLMPWVSANKGLIKSVVSIGAGFLGMKMAMGGVKLIFSSTVGEGIRFFSTVKDGYKVFKSLSDVNKLMGKSKWFTFFQALKVPTGLLDFGQSLGSGIKKWGGKGLDWAQVISLKSYQSAKNKLGSGFDWVKASGLKSYQTAKNGLGKGLALGKSFGLKGFNFAKTLGLKAVNVGKFLVFKGASGLMSGLRLAGRGLGAVTQLGGSLARVMGGALFRGLGLAGRAVMFLGRALLMNPIGLAVMVIAGGAYLIWRNWSKIKPWFLNLWSSIKSNMASAWEGIKAVWSNVGAFFSGKVAQIKSFFSNLPSAFAEFGRNIIQGLIDGVSQKWEALKSKFSELAGMVTGTVKGGFGINSPSKVFAKIGGGVMSGLGLGVARNVPPMLRQMGGVARSVAAAFAPKLAGIVLPGLVQPNAHTVTRGPLFARGYFPIHDAVASPLKMLGSMLQKLPLFGQFGRDLAAVLPKPVMVQAAVAVPPARVVRRSNEPSVARRSEAAAGHAVNPAGDVHHWHITQQAGESSEALVQKIMRAIEVKTTAKKRSYLGDIG
ncbi:hypothetical protein DTO96_102394 [Ephemeroptericola cinctiostellae]|uniref:Phage tail tape measure protein domain-containing protein n=1 Tax=Ephemeroptericola cinctiostellae TaxID=2268024 RepID=A0A345DE51_9BURK|nr:phage tail tape measure protein [Ephemeroptericola cinctiostellae]AXF86639.1 hypothetical protein DTO96_102394 [Ephemeroptericola cinctiostellae]